MEDPTLNVPCPVCQVEAQAPCRDLTFALLPGPHVERNETTPLADLAAITVGLARAGLVAPEPEPYTGDDVMSGPFAGWSIRAYDDHPRGTAYLRVVITDPDGAVAREGGCETYKVWTVLAHWRESLPELSASPGDLASTGQHAGGGR